MSRPSKRRPGNRIQDDPLRAARQNANLQRERRYMSKTTEEPLVL